MKATLRNRFATAALIAPVALAGLFAAQSVQAQPAQAYRHQWDNRAPRITDVTPSNGDRVSERGRTEISARIHDAGRAGIDYRGITLRVDGRDVTRHARIDRNEVQYRDDLAPGRHYAELSVRDRAGNTTRQSWSFDVVGRHWGDRYGYNDRW